MSNGIVTKVTGTLLLLLLYLPGVYPQDNQSVTVRLMFYNVENLFDTSNDSVTNDDEFLPGGLRRWNATRYRAKINSLFKTIAAAGNPDPPAVAGLYEIENRNVLEDLIYSTGLAKFEYSVIHEDSPDERGIDVCMIYRRDLVKIMDYNYISPPDSSGKPFRTRSVLYVKFMSGDDTIHLFLNHWPSRRGGVLNGEEQRRKIAFLLKSKTDSLASLAGNNAGIIFAGDFNATPDDETIESLTEGYSSGIKMVNLSDGLPAGQGTYKYQGTWEMIDQVLVSESLAGETNGLSAFSCTLTIFSPGFLLHDDPVFPGLTPFSTYRGYRYQAGFSDHLPVLLDIRVRKDF